MGANIPSWTAKHYGRRLTPQQFLHNRKAQDAVVRGVLGGYYRRYGARGAAAMWYSGQANPNKTYGNPPVYQYVNSVMSRAQRYSGQRVGGGGGSSGGGGSWSPRTVTPKLSEKELAERYGLTSALINSSKELKKLFNQAVGGQWTADRFQASLRNTNWWKKQPSSLRKFLIRKYSDPATHRQATKHAAHELNQMAIEMGMGDQIRGGKYTSALKDAIHNKLAWDWTDARMRDWWGGRIKVHDGVVWGEAGEVYDKLHEIAYANGLRYNDWYLTATKAVASGRSTLQREEGKIRRDAAAKYGAWAEQIKAGQNLIDLASPYIQSVSEILELPTGDIDLFSKHVEKAMTSKDPTPLWQFQRTVRDDPRWRKTNNAREGIMSVAHQVARDFGVAS